MTAMREITKWVTERERAAFVAGAWYGRIWRGHNAAMEAQRRYPDPKTKAEPKAEPEREDRPDTCPSCWYWWAEGYDHCAICGRDKR